jgi:hypothetical protein
MVPVDAGSYQLLSTSMDDAHADPIDAPPYVVTCLEEDEAAGEGHRHVTAIETRDPDGLQTRWSTVQVIAAVREGERFVVGDAETRRSLEPGICPGCSSVTLVVPAGGPVVAPCL